jgi:Rrf2 family protein
LSLFFDLLKGYYVSKRLRCLSLYGDPPVNRINRKTDYAVRILLALARRGEGAIASTLTIREEMLLPAALTRRIVADLARGGFLVTYPGRDGGIQLARPPREITLLQVVEFFEGPVHVSECIEGKVECPFELHCPVRRQWARVDQAIVKILSEISFADLAEESIPEGVSLNS